MFHRNIKLLLAILTLSYATYQFTLSNIGNGILLILLTGMFILLYFKNEMLLLAMLKMRKQNTAGTQNILNKIANPETSLVKKQRGYYNYLLGLIASQSNLTQAEKYMRRAIGLGLNFNHDLAMAKLTLSGIMMQKRRKREATILLKEAKKCDKHKMLSEQIRVMEQQMKKI